ncbi:MULTISPECIES: hypothetical protein [Bifidobacterium]|uniref:hypothetical protein n=2 Tax=Bifidobacterium TaxID=1678 RepID=UPI0014853FC6|nr:hypothetical protein [Bifidobacterium moukalabense]
MVMETDAVKARRNIPTSNGSSPTMIPVTTTSRYTGAKGTKQAMARRTSSIAYDRGG